MKLPINIYKWIEDNKELLKPPVGNKQIYSDDDMEVFVVGGPNTRTDFHINPREEFFFQLKGDMNLRVKEKNSFKDIAIKEGEIFMCPRNLPHSPQRYADTIGLIVEVKRQPEEKDSLLWYCDKCGHLLYSESQHIGEIASHLPPIFERYWSNSEHTTCQKCGHKHEKPF